MSATCRNCRHYNLEAHRNSAGKIVVRKNVAARCAFDTSRLERKLPHSVKRPLETRPVILAGTYMTPDEGQGCPQWTKRGAA